MPKAQVLEITCPEDVPPPDPDRVTAAKLVELEVILPGGAEYRGSVTLELPPGRRRTLDYHEWPRRLLRALVRRPHPVHQQAARSSRPSPRLRSFVARLDRFIQVMHEQRADALQLAVGQPAAW